MNVLAIGSHFDDVELGCGATLAKHSNNNDNVYIYVATLSGYSNQGKQPIRGNEVALKEGKKAAEILNATLLTGKFETLHLEFTDELNVELINIIEKYKIDLIYTHWHGDIHHDHQALANASLHSGRHVKRILMYRSNWYNSVYDFRGNFYVDITNYWQYKEKAIMAHKSEYNRVGKKWIEFFKNESENAGMKIGVEKAEAFEVVKWLQ